jgi:hypothetical protein
MTLSIELIIALKVAYNLMHCLFTTWELAHVHYTNVRPDQVGRLVANHAGKLQRRW